MRIINGRMPFLFGIVVVAILIVASAAHAVCESPRNICKHFDECLQRSSDNGDQIRAGVKARNGKIVLVGAQACALDLGRKREWDEWARGCSLGEYVEIVRTEMELGKVFCDRYCPNCPPEHKVAYRFAKIEMASRLEDPSHFQKQRAPVSHMVNAA